MLGQDQECQWCGDFDDSEKGLVHEYADGNYHVYCHDNVVRLNGIREAFKGLTRAEAENYWELVRETLEED